MFEWLFGKKESEKFREETKKSFSAVKDDMKVIGKWIKHLDKQDKQVFDLINSLKQELSTMKKDFSEVKEFVDMLNESEKNKQVFKKLPVLNKQTDVYDVEEGVQTGVQTGNFYDIFKTLTANERLVIFTLMNSDMKLSYEDLALLLGKERTTIRGQVNSIKQKSEGLIEELIEKNGKKRVFVPEEIKEKLSKYAKVRYRRNKKDKLNEHTRKKSH